MLYSTWKLLGMNFYFTWINFFLSSLTQFLGFLHLYYTMQHLIITSQTKVHIRIWYSIIISILIWQINMQQNCIDPWAQRFLYARYWVLKFLIFQSGTMVFLLLTVIQQKFHFFLACWNLLNILSWHSSLWE